MRKVLFAILIVVFLFSAAGVRVSSETQKNNDLGHFNPNENVSLILEFNELPIIVYQATFKHKLLSIFNKNDVDDYSSKLTLNHFNFSKAINEMGGKVNFTYDYLFNGLSCTVPAKYIEKLKKDPNLKNIYLDKKAYLDRTTAEKVIMSDVVNSMKDKNGKLITGQGIVVGIIDTGVDYNNKELGGGGFPNSKVIGGYNFADSSPDPIDKEGHGTHVAGIIAGSFNGIARDAQIRAYKVFSSDNNSTSTSTIIKGIEQAVKDKCDIINISIGTDGGAAFDNDPESVAVRNAVNAGVVMVAAAGNKGARSDLVNFPMSAPASVDQSIGVGATDDSVTGVISVAQAQIEGVYPAESPYFTEGSFKIVYCGYGSQSDFSGKDLKGKVALVQRGGNIYFGDKDINAKQAGAVGVIVFNNVSGIPDISLQSQTNPTFKDFIPFLFVSSTDGKILKDNIGQMVSINNKYGLGQIADFSANGPTMDFALKPDLVAPGINIDSTYLNNTTIKMSGTSMASPVVAGVAALLKQAKPMLTPELLKATLMNTADVLTNPDSQIPFSPLMQGSGRVNALNAVSVSTAVTPASVIFGNGDTTASATFTIQNFSNSSVSFFTNYKSYPGNNVSVSLPFLVTVPPNSKTNISATFSTTNVSLPSYGFVYLVNGSNDKLHIPFVFLPNLSVPSLIQNVRQSTTVVSNGKSMNIDFNVGIGSIIEDNNSKFNSNIAGELKVNIYNNKGQLIKTIFDKSPIYIGDYSVKIDSIDSLGMNYLLDNGNYFFKVMYLEVNEDVNSKDVYPVIAKAEDSKSFVVTGSPQGNITFFIQDNLTPLLKSGETFWVDVGIKSFKSSKSINLTVDYDPFLLQILNVKPGSIVNENVSFTDTLQPGKIFMALSSDSEMNLQGSGSVASIQFQAIGNGDGFLGLSAVTPSSFEKLVLGSLHYEISDYSRIFDLNGDGRVDSSDLNIFKSSFGAKSGDTNYNKNCDFNFDGVVDSLDFFILSKHFGEVYP
jgi:minor extracellular serine protease Vpr